jgi:hypothetical protein
VVFEAELEWITAMSRERPHDMGRKNNAFTRRGKTILLLFAILGGAAIILAGCRLGPAETTPDERGISKISGEQSVAVMPFVKGRDPANPEMSLSCPFAGFCYEETGLKADADQILTELLHEKLMNRLEDRVFPLSLTREVYPTLLVSMEETTPLDMAVLLGREIGVDYVVAGNVWRYSERVGSALGVAEPASVAFSLYLVDAAEQKAVWQANFNETQQSLSENLLKAPAFFKRGAKWLTAKQLARHGIEEMLGRFPLGQ